MSKQGEHESLSVCIRLITTLGVLILSHFRTYCRHPAMHQQSPVVCPLKSMEWLLTVQPLDQVLPSGHKMVKTSTGQQHRSIDHKAAIPYISWYLITNNYKCVSVILIPFCYRSGNLPDLLYTCFPWYVIYSRNIR